MKKLLYLFIASTLLISCNSNDDNSPDLDPIIGTWQLQSIQAFNQEQTTACTRQSTLIFSENGTASINSFADADDGSGDCERYSDMSNWENSGNSTYKIDDDVETFTIDFSENNTVFTSSLSHTDNGTTYTIAIVYKKL